MKNIRQQFLMKHSPEWRKVLQVRGILFFLLLCCSLTATAQGKFVVSGKVLDNNDEPLIGATIALKGNTSVGTVADFDGNFTLELPEKNATLTVSYIGFLSQDVEVKGRNMIVIRMREDSEMLDEVVVVGYGQQKKESVVGAITQTKGEVLQRAGGVSDIGAALTGNLPGVITTASSGLPGEEEPQIVIRGSSSWNNSSPLVLVDGIERPMSSVDINSVESISVLKDASATAVYGVKGANGVILITTKRGQEGKAQIDVSAQATMKVPSKLPNKLDSYDALRMRNIAVEHELALSNATGTGAWDYITPMSTINKYRYPANLEEYERYPNVDWQDVLFKDYTMSYNASLNVSGGTKFVRYFVGADFLHEGDLFNVMDNGRGYSSGFGYNRINVRSNLDFSLTKTTTLKVNIAGSNGAKKTPWGYTNSGDWAIAQYWAGAYSTPPDVFLPQYSDGSWGYYPNVSNVSNSAANLSLAGTMNTTTTRINTDFTLEQDLSFITNGLRARAMVSWDNVFVEINRGVNDLYNNTVNKWIDPETGIVYLDPTEYNSDKFDPSKNPIMWTTSGGEVDNNATQRNMNYQVQLDWAREFGDHNVTAMGLFSRQETATGSIIPNRREDWAFRGTYNYANKYFFEYNGAYNGSEKFSPEYRFAFFNSGAIGWMISEEKFMGFSKKWLDMLKIRASYGEIGDDNVTDRWLYLSQWGVGGGTNGATPMALNQAISPYTWYRETTVGNPDIHWETVKKFNLGIDYSFLNGLFAGTVEVFRDKRTDVIVTSGDRAVPFYFGMDAPAANLGKVKTHGYELELRVNKVFANEMRLWGNFNMTHAVNEIIQRDDPLLQPAYQKEAGYSIGQNHAHIDAGFMGNYDQIYGSPAHDTNENQKLPGDYYIVDFNADGVVDAQDSAPYGYSSTPQNTYSATVGFEWKGFSAFVQFYGVTNVTRDVTLTSFSNRLNTVYDVGDWWSKYNSNADVVVPRLTTTPSYNTGTQNLYDGSFIRLKNAEIAYTFDGGWVQKLGIRNLKVFLNGNNLWVWTRMPDDRESNFSGASNQGAYPTMKRFNLGIKFTL